MERYNIEELMALNWVFEIAEDEDGDCVLTVNGLEDFTVYGRTDSEVLQDFDEALRSHLMGYLVTGKVVPAPIGRVVQIDVDGETGSVWDWRHYFNFNVGSGRTRRSQRAAV